MYKVQIQGEELMTKVDRLAKQKVGKHRKVLRHIVCGNGNTCNKRCAVWEGYTMKCTSTECIKE